MSMRTKYIGQPNPRFVKSFTSQVARVDDGDLHGFVGFMKVREVQCPLIVGEPGAEVCLTDIGYSELGWLPDGENWCLWAIYDDRRAIVDWYFDITKENGVDADGKPYCDDLYLDAALMPDGCVLILDEDELTAALDAGTISHKDYEMAHRTLENLLQNGTITVAHMEKLCAQLFTYFTER